MAAEPAGDLPPPAARSGRAGARGPATNAPLVGGTRCLAVSPRVTADPMIRAFGYYVSRIYLGLGLTEALIFLAAYHLGVLVRFGWQLPPDSPDCAACPTSAVFTLVMTLSVLSLGLYQRGAHEGEVGFIVRLGAAFGIGTTLLALLFYIFPSLSMGRGVLLLALGFSFIGVLLLREGFGRVVGAESLKRRVLVLGAGAGAQRIEDALAEESGLGFVVIGYVPLPDEERAVSPQRLLDGSRPLIELAYGLSVDEIVVAGENRRGQLPVADLLDCKLSGFPIMDLLTFFEKELAVVRIDLLYPSWIIFSADGFRPGFGSRWGKRAMDLTIASLMLLVFLPVMGVVALASLIESRFRDPVLYHQVRVGLDGMPFRLHKFRSMRVDAEADGQARWASHKDHRVTRLGAFLRRTRLDELPQLFNVLRGEMSLVGPRPERPEFVEQLSRRIPFYGERHRVKPGVTGWAQLLYQYGASEDDARRKLEFDLYYVKHCGLVLDLIILLQTVEIVLLGKGAR